MKVAKDSDEYGDELRLGCTKHAAFSTVKNATDFIEKKLVPVDPINKDEAEDIKNKIKKIIKKGNIVKKNGILGNIRYIL